MYILLAVDCSEIEATLKKSGICLPTAGKGVFAERPFENESVVE